MTPEFKVSKAAVAERFFLTLFFLLTAALGFAWFTQKPAEPPTVRFSVAPPENAKFGSNARPVLSPDGRHLAFVATAGAETQIWIRDLDAFTSRPLPGTEGAADSGFWSPDSRFLAFASGGKLKKIDLSGERAVVLCDAAKLYGGIWNKDDVILFTPGPGGIFRVSAAGGTPVAMNTVETGKELTKIALSFLPDGRHFLYAALSLNLPNSALYAGELDSKTQGLVLTGAINASYSPPGYLVFGRDRTLMARPFDASKLQLTGEAVPVADNVAHSENGFALFSISQNGVLAYATGSASGDTSSAFDVVMNWTAPLKK